MNDSHGEKSLSLWPFAYYSLTKNNKQYQMLLNEDEISNFKGKHWNSIFSNKQPGCLHSMQNNEIRKLFPF